MRSLLLACGVTLATTVVAVGCGSDSATKTVTTTVSAPSSAPATTSTGAAPTTTTPSKTFVTFGDGTYTVGKTVKAGTYRAPTPSSLCYWERLAGFSGSLDDKLANETTSDPTVVSILPTDAGFRTDGCGTWTSDLSAITSSRSSFPAGTYIVNVDISPGSYSAPGSSQTSPGSSLPCSWARLSGFTGTLDDIIANELPSGNTVVTIAPTDKGFHSEGCGTFTAAGPPTPQIPATVAASPPTVEPRPRSGFSSCGGGVEALTATTSCEFAQNVFYGFYEAAGESQFQAYSPSTGKEYQVRCTGQSTVTCRAGIGAEVRFPMSAVQAYTGADASAYANSHDLGQEAP